MKIDLTSSMVVKCWGRAEGSVSLVNNFKR